MATRTICSCAPRALSAGPRVLRRSNARCLPSLRRLSPCRADRLWPFPGTPFLRRHAPAGSHSFVCLQSGTDESRLALRVPAAFGRRVGVLGLTGADSSEAIDHLDEPVDLLFGVVVVDRGANVAGERAAADL